MATFEQRITIDATVDRVWETLRNPATWVQWFPDVDRITGLSAVESGATFQWHRGEESGAGTIVAVDDARGLIKVVTSDSGGQVTHIFDLDRAGGLFGLGGNDTRLTYQREYDAPGGLLGEFIAGGNPADLLKVKRTLERVKDLIGG
jgi:carbon monoxide dehydrogenase subunit G